MPAPRYTIPQYTKQYENFNCTEEQKKQIFEDAQDSSKTERVEGWSFVQRDDDVMLNNNNNKNKNNNSNSNGNNNQPQVVHQQHERGGGYSRAESTQQPQNYNNQLQQ